MKLIIGLGNPGEKYKLNRHNVGHTVIDRLIKPKIKAIKTNVFMNDSGTFVKDFVRKYSLPVSELYIIHDDLDLPLGSWKMQFAKGPKVHGGINDIEQKLDTKDFTRIRIGVDNRKPEERVSGEEYVLQDFSDDERSVIDGVIEEVCKKLETL